MINRSRYFSRIDTKPARSDYKAIKEKTITLLKEHPHGMTVDELACACGLSSSRLISLILRERFTDLPIGYDRRIDNRLYWVGR